MERPQASIRCISTSRNVTTYTITTLADCTTYYFAVTAYDISRNESSYSNQVSKTTTCPALPPPQYTLTVTKAGTGSGTVTSSPVGINCGTDCSEPFAQNAVVQLTAAPAAKSNFGGWSGSCTGTATTCSVTVNAAKTATATFTIKQFTITASAGANGSISPSGSVPVNYGTNRTFTITPNANYRVADVRVDNVSMGAITTYTFSNVTANHTIAATFTANTTALTVTKSGTGSGTVTSSPAGINCGTDCSEPFALNTVVQLTRGTGNKLDLHRLVRQLYGHRDNLQRHRQRRENRDGDVQSQAVHDHRIRGLERHHFPQRQRSSELRNEQDIHDHAQCKLQSGGCEG